jgi:hypothetical protein
VVGGNKYSILFYSILFLRVLRLEVSVNNVYIKNQFQTTFAQSGGRGEYNALEEEERKNSASGFKAQGATGKAPRKDW